MPAVVAFLKPFRLVMRADDTWSCSLEQINTGRYDYVKLSRATHSVDVGLPPPLTMLVGFDGSLVLPATRDLAAPDRAADAFNGIGRVVVRGRLFGSDPPR